MTDKKSVQNAGRKAATDKKFVNGWGEDIADHGFLALPHLIRRKVLKQLTGTQAKVFLELAFWFQQDGFKPLIKVGLKQLATDTGLSTAQVSRILKELEKAGWIAKQPINPMERYTCDFSPSLVRMYQLAEELAEEKEAAKAAAALKALNEELLPRLAWRLSTLATKALAGRLPSDGRSHQVTFEVQTLGAELLTHFGSHFEALGVPPDLASLDDAQLQDFAEDRANRYLMRLELQQEQVQQPAAPAITKMPAAAPSMRQREVEAAKKLRAAQAFQDAFGKKEPAAA